MCKGEPHSDVRVTAFSITTKGGGRGANRPPQGPRTTSPEGLCFITRAHPVAAGAAGAERGSPPLWQRRAGKS